MTADEILKKHEDKNEMHFHNLDRKWIIEAMEEYAKPILSGSMLTDKQIYEIAKKHYEYCYIREDDKLALGCKAIPLIFDDCLKFFKGESR